MTSSFYYSHPCLLLVLRRVLVMFLRFHYKKAFWFILVVTFVGLFLHTSSDAFQASLLEFIHSTFMQTVEKLHVLSFQACPQCRAIEIKRM